MFSVTRKTDQANVIVCGNEKGGSGKTTTIMHITVALLNAGYRVATLDLDTRQKSFSRYIQNRANYSARRDLELSLPNHFVIERGTSDSILKQQESELNALLEIITSIQFEHDFVLIDTPGHDGYLMQMAHAMADKLITPMNDSYVDFDVLGHVDPETGQVETLSHYAKTVRAARRNRRIADNGLLDWVVVRNRLSHIGSRNKESMHNSLNNLAMQLGCRLAEGISERVIFRELFPKGLTALDDLDRILANLKGNASHLTARQEVRSLISTLKLPMDELAKKRSEAEQVKREQDTVKPVDTLGL